MGMARWSKGVLIASLGITVVGTGTRAQAQPFPAPGTLPMIAELPDPFRMADGSRVATVADWRKRREELKALILHYEYGHPPDAPGNISATELSSENALGGKAIDRRLRLTMQGGKVSFRLRMLIPTAGAGPYPVLVKNDRNMGLMPIPEEAIDRGYILCEFVRTDIAVDGPDRTDGAFPAYPDADWRTLAAWAWGHWRVMDYLFTLDIVDKAHVAITGQSRGGKTALLAGALDERIALTAPNGSGAGGCGTYRLQGTGAEKMSDIVRVFPFWFVPRLGEFVGQETRLPFDQHELKAMVAPRALLCSDALGDLWANPQGATRSHWAAREVYKFLGVPGKIGLHFRAGAHEQSEDDWRTFMDFADLQFFGKPSKRNFDTTAFPGLTKGYSWTAPAPVSVIAAASAGKARPAIGEKRNLLGRTGGGATGALRTRKR